MKAVAVRPGDAGSVHLAELEEPTIGEIAGGRGVEVRILRVGVDGTDKEINAAEYGNPPEGSEFLVLGHESLGIVERVGANVTELAPGDLVVATVRRPGGSFYDRIGAYDLTTDDVYYERGINLRHGFLTERVVDDPEFLIKLPGCLRETGVLLEPLSIVEKGIVQAYEIQRRLRIWNPHKAAVLGAGTIGLLAALALRLRGLEVVSFGREEPPHRNSELVEALGARYASTRETPLLESAERHGPFDLIFEATGFSPLVFEAMRALGKNGVLVLASVTGGDRKAEVPADAINLDFVLGNKALVGTVNAHREHFEQGVRDLTQAQSVFPGWLERLLTHPVHGLEGYEQLFDALENGRDVIKAYCIVAEA